MSDTLRTVNILAFDDVQLLDVSGPMQVFASANELCLERGKQRPYEVRVVSASGKVVSSAGLGLDTFPLPVAGAGADTFIVAGGRGVHAASKDLTLLRWVREHTEAVRRIASVCTGAFLLAAAGLLDQRRVVTHWAHCQALGHLYPMLRIEPDPIYIRDGEVWTSAGVTAGIDLALAFVEADCGRGLALDVARELVVFLKRPGGQAQFSATLLLQNASDDFEALHAWIAENLTSDMSVPALARRAGMSERSFVRHYRDKTGNTPARAIELFRTEAALRLLVDTALPVKRIALKCGFGSEDSLRRSVMKVCAVTPQAYRERFGGQTTSR
ncbi:transcriptional regulator GlxA family with amidase domain [Robbsia andropogonis]|uniref:GlxA family transcriptional regulator n=1 Tax=Robbsia andropogonis TaxID=28092 RepID=UPI00389A1DA4